MSEWRSPPIMSPEEEKQRQAIVAALGKGKSKGKPLSYYLGPLADTLNDAGRFAWAMSPGDDYQYSAEGFNKALDGTEPWLNRAAGLGQGIAGAAMFAVPGVSAGLADDATRAAIETAAQSRPMRAVGDFVDDEAGAVRIGPTSQNLASRAEKLDNSPSNSEVGDALGRQHTGGLDIEGRSLVARHVVGRTPDRGLKKSLPTEAIAEIGERFTRDGFRRRLHLGDSQLA